ncbi:hypothetical protein C8R47DRAFT_9817 [Mycena vitilis]|nr:hypothetical protein C8R47DRAFT_9817 [Mycena vitilis]
MPVITIQGGMLLGTVLESMGYGVLTVLTAFTLKALADNRQTRYPSKLLLTVLTLIWLLSTGHWISNVFRSYNAFVRFPGGPALFYDQLNLPSYTVRNVMYCTLVMVADSFAVYRVYRCYNGSWAVAAFPMVMVAGSMVCGYGTTFFFATGTPGSVFSTMIIPWGTAWYAMNLSTNIICTSLVAFKIIQGQRAVRKLSKVSSDRLWNTLVIILESAALYSAALIVLMTTTLLGTNSAFTALDINVSVVGITFALIILRVSLGVSSDTQSYGGSTVGATDSALRMPTRSTRSNNGDLTVNVSRLVELDHAV